MSTAATVEAAIVERLLAGGLPPGTWLRQDALATELGVSKIPVREALQRLAADGTVDLVANRGVRVPHLTPAGATEVFALRAGVEIALLREAMGKHTVVDLAEAEHALERADLSQTAANWAFHAALYRPAQWQRGLRMAHSLHAAVAGYVLRYVDELGGAAGSRQEHLALLDCCRAGDRTGATSLLRRHLTTAADTLVDQLEMFDVPH